MKVTAPLLYSYDKKDTRRDITCANFEIKPVSYTHLVAERSIEVHLGLALRTALGCNDDNTIGTTGTICLLYTSRCV